ncbi:MAG TPA: hypothetical protein VGB04_14480, partial [Allosphingosinicella sp.]
MVQLYDRSGGEFLVNTVTLGAQGNPLMTRLASGGFVLVWSDYGEADDYRFAALKAQIYDSTGGKVGGEIQVSSSTVYWSADGLAALPNGGFIVTYGTGQVTAQMFDAAGAKIGGEIVVTAFDPAVPAEWQQDNVNGRVAVLASGEMVITWDKRVRYDVDIYAQVLTPEGVKSGAGFRINPFISGHQQISSITALASGGFVVTWDDSVEYEGGLRGQAFDVNRVPVGNSFRVSTTVWGAQDHAALAALPGGGFVAVWQNHDVDEETFSTRGQIFTDAGVKVGPEFLVGPESQSIQFPASVDDLPGGGFVVTWYDRGRQGGDSSEGAIMAQVFDSAGAKVGNPFLVNSETDGNQNMPAVAGLASGGFAIAWTSDSGGDDIKAQIFMPATGGPTDIALSPGAVLEASIGNYAVATFSHNGAVNSPVTYTLLADSTDGGFRIEGNRLVVEDNRRLDHETAPTAGLIVRVTDANGNSYDEAISVAITDSAVEERYSAGADFTASSTGSAVYAQAAIGALASGGYVMSWISSDGQGSTITVRAQMFDSEGARAGGELTVSPASAGNAFKPAAAGLAAGGFVIVWHDDRATDGDPQWSGIRGQRFDSAGARVGDEFLVNTITAESQYEPTVAALASGGFVVAWTDASNSTAGDSGYGDVRAQMYDASGAKVGGELLVNSTTYAEQSGAAIAALPGGGFIVTWMDLGSEAVAAQRFDSAGNKVGGEIRLPGGYDPAVAVLASGGFVISWSGYGGQTGDSSFTSIEAQLFGADGAKLGGAFLVNTQTDGPQLRPSITALLWGGFVVSWQDSPVGSGWPDTTSVRAQMFDAAGVPIGEEFIVPAGAEGGQVAPVSTILSSGSFVIGWTDLGSAGTMEGRVFTLAEPPSTLQVGPGGFATIQAAVDAAKDGDTIVIAAGTYAENVNVNKDLALLGPNQGIAGTAERGAEAVIDGMVTISADGVTIDGLKFVGRGISPLGGQDALAVLADAFKATNSVFSAAIAANGAVHTAQFITRLEISNNLVQGYFNGIHIGLDSIGSVHGNRFQGGTGEFRLLNGLVSLSSQVTISGNVFDGIDSASLGLAPFGPDPVDLDSYVTGNIFTNSGVEQPVLILPTRDSPRIVGTDHDERFDAREGGYSDPDNLFSFDGRGGDDQVFGGAHGDSLSGGEGNDFLDGGAGADSMAGGQGDDIYVVDHPGDSVAESAGEGKDEIRTGLASYSLAALPNVEKLTATNSAAHDFKGNSGNNVITGGAGNDLLSGGTGFNSVDGGGGDDVINSVNLGVDTIVGGSGNDVAV